MIAKRIFITIINLSSIDELKLKVRSNLSMVYLKRNLNEKARECCDEIIIDDSKNVKAFYRKGIFKPKQI